MIKKILITISILTFIFSTTFAINLAGQKIIKNPERSLIAQKVLEIFVHKTERNDNTNRQKGNDIIFHSITLYS